MRRFCFTFLSFLLSVSCFSSIWQRKITNYERTQYMAGHQNWKIKQSSSKWMYFANSSGMLEYDGANWSLYPIKNKIVRSLNVVDEKRRIYAGGSSEFGFYAPDESGRLIYNSLTAERNDWGGEVWEIYRNKNTVYFVADGNIHIYNEDSDKVKSLTTYGYYKNADCATFINSRLYVGSLNGIFFLNKNDTLDYIQSTSILKGKKIVALLPYKSKIIAVTSREGLYLVDEGSCEKINSPADSFIQSNQLFCADIFGSKVILGSVQNGAVLFDWNTNVLEKFNIETGLSNNTVLSTSFDDEGNLWLGLNRGVGYVNLNSPIRPLFTKESPIGSGYCSFLFNKELYLGTNQGLYKVYKDNQLSMIKDSEGQIWSLFQYENTLFSSGDNGITVVSPSGTYKIGVGGMWAIQSLPYDRDRLIVGMYSGFGVLHRKNGKWEFSHTVPEFFFSTRGFFVDSDEYTFWVMDASKDVVCKVTFDRWFSRVERIKKYSFPNNKVGDNSYIRQIDNTIVVCTTKGIYQYSKVSDNFARYTELESVLKGQQMYGYLDVDKLNNIWFVDEQNNLKLSRNNGGRYTHEITNWSLSSELIGGYENVEVNDSLAIVAVDNAFLQLEIFKDQKRTESLKVIIRKLTFPNDSVIYVDDTNKIKLPYSMNSIGIHYVATNYSNSSNTLYSYMLKGIDNNWSSPSVNVVKEYTNLREGEYTFLVRAFETNSPEEISTASITFRISPPWYRSIWAYLLYSILSVVLISFFLRKLIDARQQKIIREKDDLLAKNKFIEQENKLKDEEIYMLQNEKLQNDLHYKAQELTGYILNLSRKNEMLEEVKKSVTGISKTLDEGKDKTVIKQKVVRLITQINGNIEHDDDFNIFKSNFDLVHKNFFQQLGIKHPELTRNDKLLCVYLKMNLSSKEIAPLLNISIRGVEVNRYRLRKKMGLDRTVNLTEYLQGFDVQ